MALKIRLRQQGRNNRQTFRLVLADTRSPRDGKYIEMLGWYHPVEAKDNLFIDAERTQHWLQHGAILTHQARSLLSKAAPDVLKAYDSKVSAKRTKLVAKRRALKKVNKAK